MTDDVRAITVRPLWSEAIVTGDKPVENRSGGFPRNYTGRLLVHSAMTWSKRAQMDRRIRAALFDGAEQTVILQRLRYYQERAGHVIGEVDLVDVHKAEEGCCESEWAELEYADAQDRQTFDVVHLVLERPIAYAEPIRARGALGLWRPKAELLLKCAPEPADS